MISMAAKLILICLCILFAIGFFDLKTNDSNEPYSKIEQKAGNSDLKSDFAGKEFWEDIDQQLCDDHGLDRTWKKPESLCYSVIRGYEETRMEVLSTSPPLVVYRQFYTEKQIDDYSRMFKKRKLEKQTVVSFDGISHSVSPVLVASGLVTSASDFPEAQSLHDTASRLIPAINFENSEPIMGLKFDIKGHYAPHYDYLEISDLPEDDNRIATLSITIKAASVGGGTVFPYLGTVVRARPGDAILWFNMKQNRKHEPLALFGECPVHSGEKIIATIAVERRGQQLFRPFYEDKSFSADVLLR
ncbi:unnamed protein product [Caenorhabditis brenneri]